LSEELPDGFRDKAAPAAPWAGETFVVPSRVGG
jgi:hypothetical protein